MRVITGSFKGRKLKTVPDLSVRPATDRVKQTLFDILANRIRFEETNVLDLFAGSGALGIEALSRGAAHVTFVEINEEAAGCIEQNVRSLGCEETTEIHETDAMDFVLRSKDSFDLIFADPPYGFEGTMNIPSLVFQQKLLKPHGYLLIEHATDVRFQGSAWYRVGPEKKFGRTVVTFFQRETYQHQEAGRTL